MRRKLSDAAKVITVSDYNLEYLQQTYGAAAARVQRIYNGLDLGSWLTSRLCIAHHKLFQLVG
jgi:hypothetical protein